MFSLDIFAGGAAPRGGPVKEKIKKNKTNQFGGGTVYV